MPRSTASATMFDAAPVSSFITTIPPKPIMESFSPVLPRVRLAIGLDGVVPDACSWLADATVAAVRAACLRNSRRFMVCLHHETESWSELEKWPIRLQDTFLHRCWEAGSHGLKPPILASILVSQVSILRPGKHETAQ